MEMVKIPFP